MKNYKKVPYAVNYSTDLYISLIVEHQHQIHLCLNVCHQHTLISSLVFSLHHLFLSRDVLLQSFHLILDYF